jgi:DNA-binding MarR family transcriptional regulator
VQAVIQRLAETDDLPLAEQLFETFGSLRRQVRRLAGRPWPVGDLSGSQIELVRLVRREPGIPVNSAAERLRLAPNTVSTLVRSLTEAGLLQRQADPADRRVARLRVTAAARRRIEGWRDQRTVLAASALSGLSLADRRAIRDALPAVERLVAALQREEDQS